MKDTTKGALIGAVATVMVAIIGGGVNCYTSSKKEAAAPNTAAAHASPTATANSMATATASPTISPTIIVQPSSAPSPKARGVDQRAGSNGLNIAGSVNAPLQYNGPGSHGNSLMVGTPPRHVTDENREAIRASIRANLPKDALVQVQGKWGDSEAITYALELYDLIQSDGYAKLKPKVLQGYAVVPKPPVSVQKADDGSYYILFVDGIH